MILVLHKINCKMSGQFYNSCLKKYGFNLNFTTFILQTGEINLPLMFSKKLSMLSCLPALLVALQEYTPFDAAPMDTSRNLFR